jgi:alkylation response protein AidB-like acyl-CoA dehydrogenase
VTPEEIPTMSDRPRPLTVPTEDQQQMLAEVRRFAEEGIRPKVAEMDAVGKLDPAILKTLFEMGLMGIDIPDQYGGSGMTFSDAILVIMELARVDPSVSVLCDVQNTLVNNAIHRWGTPEQQRSLLARLTSDTVGAYALSEAGSGSDAFALRTRAVRDGDFWRLSGNKLWITNGYEAGVFLVFANADPEKGYKGITCFIVERGDAGFTVGKKEDKLGLRASSTTELILENCAIPADSVIGEIGKGYKVAMETLNAGRIGIGAQMVGVAQGALDATINYVSERKQFGKAIGEFQGVQFQLAQAWTELQAARLLVYNAARLRDMGQPHMLEGAMAKLYASQAANSITSLCVDLYGGYGFTKEYPVEKFYRDAKIGTIYEGTSNMQLQTIAKGILKTGS